MFPGGQNCPWLGITAIEEGLLTSLPLLFSAPPSFFVSFSLCLSLSLPFPDSLPASLSSSKDAQQFATPGSPADHLGSEEYDQKTVALVHNSRIEIAGIEFRVLSSVGLGLIPILYLPTKLMCPGSNHLIHNLPSFSSRLVSNPQNVRTESSFGVTQRVSPCCQLWLLCAE